jgi:hypothetical protein
MVVTDPALPLAQDDPCVGCCSGSPYASRCTMIGGC